jgi:hypothetical protein
MGTFDWTFKTRQLMTLDVLTKIIHPRELIVKLATWVDISWEVIPGLDKQTELFL